MLTPTYCESQAEYYLWSARRNQRRAFQCYEQGLDLQASRFARDADMDYQFVKIYQRMALRRI